MEYIMKDREPVSMRISTDEVNKLISNLNADESETDTIV